MRVEEVFGYQRLNEGPFGPYGVVQRAKDTAMSKVKGLVGHGQEEQGNIEAGDKANMLYKDFKKFVGQTVGSGQKYVEAQVLLNWMKTRKLNAASVDIEPDEMITPNQAQQYIMSAARSSYIKQPKADSAQPAPAAKKPNMFGDLSPEQRAKLLKLLSQ